MTRPVYRRLTRDDLPQAENLWKTCFDDPESFVQWYFDTRFPPETARGLFDGETLLCMVQLVPYRIRLRGVVYPGIYIVGLATRPDSRERGLATLLLENALTEQYAEGLTFTVLMPAVPPYYIRRGWIYGYEFARHRLAPASLGSTGSLRPFSPSDLPDVESIYTLHFARLNGLFQRTPKDWTDLLFDHEADGGRSLIYLDETLLPSGYLLVMPGSAQVLVREAAFAKPDQASDAVACLSGRYPDQPILWTSAPGQAPPTPSLSFTTEPQMMVRGVHLTRWIESLSYPENAILDMRFSVYDPLLPQNRRAFYWRVRSGCGSLAPIPDNPGYPQVGIGEITAWIMGVSRDAPPEVGRILPPTVNYCNDLF